METRNELNNYDDDTRASHCCLFKRYLLAGALCLGSFNTNALRTNTSIAIVEMTNNKTGKAEFEWNSTTKGFVLSSYIYGYAFVILGALVAKRLGGVTTYATSLLVTGTLNILNPHIVRFNFHLFLVAKSLEGLLENYAYISTSEIWSRWAPPKERSKLLSFGFTGGYIGTAFTFPICGFVIHLWGRPSAFYFTGGCAVISSLILLLSFGDQPSSDKCISREELGYLQREINSSQSTRLNIRDYPWKEILTTKPVWALFLAKFAYACGFSFISICLPLYIKDRTGRTVLQIGILSSLPNMASIFTVPIAGYLADYLQNRNLLSTTMVHKVYMVTGFVLGAFCIFSVACISNFTINMISLIFFKILISLNYLTIQLVPLCLAPKYSSLLAAITVYGFALGSLFTPIFIGQIVTQHESRQWNTCFVSFGTILLLGGLSYALFGSSDARRWARAENINNTGRNTETLL